MTAILRREAIEVSRDLNLAVGIPATVRRSRFPRGPRPNVSRPVERASAKSRFSTTTAVQLWWTARSSNVVIAARTRPSRRVARIPAVSTGMVTGAPTGLPEESRTHAAR
jgi:hypothetical protein